MHAFIHSFIHLCFHSFSSYTFNDSSAQNAVTGLTSLLSLRSFCLVGAAGEWQTLTLWSVYTGVYLPGVCHPLRNTSVMRAECVPCDVPGPGRELSMLEVLPK